MKTQFDINKLLEKGVIDSELELEQAFSIDKKLRLLSKKDASFIIKRKKLRTLIENYEKQNWSIASNITDNTIRESDIAEDIAETERLFIAQRKEIIRKNLKNFNLNQQQLGEILGHFSKSYMSELMNGICPFSMRDLVIIHRILEIELKDLIPTTIPHQDRVQIKSSLMRLRNTKVRLSKKAIKVIHILSSRSVSSMCSCKLFNSSI
jgi:transcriptional regulator with XRE-family HTH domain